MEDLHSPILELSWAHLEIFQSTLSKKMRMGIAKTTTQDSDHGMLQEVQVAKMWY